MQWLYKECKIVHLIIRALSGIVALTWHYGSNLWHWNMYSPNKLFSRFVCCNEALCCLIIAIGKFILCFLKQDFNFLCMFFSGSLRFEYHLSTPIIAYFTLCKYSSQALIFSKWELCLRFVYRGKANFGKSTEYFWVISVFI